MLLHARLHPGRQRCLNPEGAASYRGRNLSAERNRPCLAFADVRSRLAPEPPKRSECRNTPLYSFVLPSRNPRILRASLPGAIGYSKLMIGSPGSGKTMLARRMASILPPLTPEESLETTRIYSALGYLKSGESLLATRPFRSPHHTISLFARIKGGRGSSQPFRFPQQFISSDLIAVPEKVSVAGATSKGRADGY